MLSEKIAAVFLARCADGIEPLRRFADSYRKHDAGIEHDLVVIYKGYEHQEQLTAARAAFDGLRHVEILVPDASFDIGSYLEGCRRLPHGLLAFLNTHSEIVSPRWLANLFRAATKPGVGIAGAMGSYESIRDTVRLLRAVIWRSIGTSRTCERNLAYYFDFVLARYHPTWYGLAGGAPPATAMSSGPLHVASEWLAKALKRSWFERSGTSAIWPGAPAFDSLQFPGFPNPHIRTNGFMMRRQLLLRLGAAQRIEEKIDTNLFESGPEGLTARLRSSGMAARVVSRDGTDYDVQDWWMSNTFRLGLQQNLMISDNHTRAFEAMTPGARATHSRLTWGDYIGAPPDDFPDLGVTFQKAIPPLRDEPKQA